VCVCVCVCVCLSDVRFSESDITNAISKAINEGNKENTDGREQHMYAVPSDVADKVFLPTSCLHCELN